LEGLRDERHSCSNWQQQFWKMELGIQTLPGPAQIVTLLVGNKLQQVYTVFVIGQPNSDYTLTTLYNDRDGMVKTYVKVKEEIDVFVKKVLSGQDNDHPWAGQHGPT
jgi:hypothetical protein